MNKLDSVTTKELTNVCLSSTSLAEVLRHFGFAISGVNYKTLKNRINEDAISITHFRKRERNHHSFDTIFMMNSPSGVDSAKKIKLLIDNGILIYQCSDCHISNEYNGKSITLQLDHINGNNSDNRVENLRLLCPNCHSQTKTWGSRNSKKKVDDRFCVICVKLINKKYAVYCDSCLSNVRTSDLKKRHDNTWPTVDKIKRDVSRHGWTIVGVQLGVSDNAVRKHLQSNGVDIKRWRTWFNNR